MNPNVTDLRDRIADADPADDALPYTPERCAAVVTDILSETSAARIGCTTRARVWGRRSRPPSYSRSAPRRFTAALVAASIVAIVAGLLAITSQGGGGSSQAAQSVLVTAATNASDPPARASQYWKITQSSPRVTRTTYYAVDGNRPTYFVDHYPADRDPQQAEYEIWTTNLTQNQEPSGWSNPNPVYLASLPRDPQALRQLLYRDTAGRGNSIDGEAFTYVADLLRSGTVPADLRRSLFQVLQTIPNVDVTSTRITVGGRTGTVLSYGEQAPLGLHEILLDVGTGMMLAERDTGTTGWSEITRTLIDQIPADVQAAARHDTCSHSGQGVACTQATPQPS